MQRPCCCLLRLIVATLVWTSTQSLLLAADDGVAGGQWPNLRSLDRGPGFYLSMTNILLCYLVMVAWVKTTDWISRDAQSMKLPFYRCNAIAFGTFVVAMAMVWMLPYFLAAFALLLIAYLGPLGWYVIYRNGKVEDHQKVLTSDHVRYLASQTLRPLGIKIDAEKPDARDLGADVKFNPSGTLAERDSRALLLQARQSAAYPAVRELIALAVATRADAVMLEFAEAKSRATALRYRIDGVWNTRTAYDHETASGILDVLQTLAALDTQQRDARLEGEFQAVYEATIYDCRLTCRPTKSGYRVLLRINDKQRPVTSLEESGMNVNMREQLHELLHRQQGLIVFSSLPEGGLTTTFDLALESSDRMMRDFIAIEDQDHRETDIENITVATYSAAEGQTPNDVLPAIIRKYPDVIIVRDLADAETADLLAKQVSGENRLVFTSVRAKDALESLLRVLALKADRAAFSQAVAAAVGVRLMRRLCDACKEPYRPSPAQLKQLGIPAGKLKTLYRPGQPNPQPKKGEPETCLQCEGIGYFGRVGLYELVVVDDRLRQVLSAQPTLDLLREAARMSKMRSFQHAGATLVAGGVTSIEELQRVLNKK